MNSNNRIKNKVKTFLSSAKQEIEKTTSLGKKMLNASKTNSELHNTYEELGEFAYKMMKDGHLEWNHAKAKELTKRIDILEEELKLIEDEVKKLKMASGPEDISRNDTNSKE
jgi:hypothetical protein